MKLLLDEMYEPGVSEGLRRLGVDAASIHDPGLEELRGAPDADVLAAASAAGRALVTENVRDFRRLELSLASSETSHSGLVYTTNRRFPRGQPATSGRLVASLAALASARPRLTGESLFLEAVDG